MRRGVESDHKRLEGVVGQQLKADLQQATVVTCALSGGIDSVVLLDLLRLHARALGFELKALHVNHELSANADRWARFCAMHCARRNIPFVAVRVRVQGNGKNIEAQARRARYGAFARHGTGVVALAHHLDDQAETVLLQLLRGAGVRGLSAMPSERDAVMPADGHGLADNLKPMRILRPLLSISRAEIEKYARHKRLRWIDDESNSAERFARNFLRKRILPALERRFPGCRRALARSSLHLAEAGRLLDELAAIDAGSIVAGARLRVAGLRGLSNERATNVLRHFLHSHGIAAPNTQHLAEILRQLCTSHRDANPRLQLDAVCLRVYKGWAELIRQNPVDDEVHVLAWSGESSLALPTGGELRVRNTRGRGISRAKLTGTAVSVRWRRGGERIRPDDGRPRRTLKNLLQELRVPPWQREAMPLLYVADQLVWAPGVGADCAFRAEPGEAALLFTWRRPDETSASRRE